MAAAGEETELNLTPEELATTLGLLLTKQLELLSPQQPHQPGLPSVLSLSNQPAHLKSSLHHQTPQQNSRVFRATS